MLRGGGMISLDDLDEYHAEIKAPLRGEFRGRELLVMPPSSSGGILLLQMLAMLERFPLDQIARDPVAWPHLFTEVARRAYADRAVHLGDPAFATVPEHGLLDPRYIEARAATISLERATPSDSVAAGDAGRYESDQTTHLDVIDRAGNAVALTTTLNDSFGSGIVVEGAGFLLNNEMDDFSAKPGVPNQFGLVGGEANAIAPHKRMLSSVTPTFVDSGKRLMIGGSPGGSFIPGMVLLATLDFMDGANAAAIVGHPRIHMQYLPDTVLYEPDALTPDEVAALAAQGDTLKLSGRRWGNFQAIVWDREAGKVEAASDPRVEGGASVE